MSIAFNTVWPKDCHSNTFWSTLIYYLTTNLHAPAFFSKKPFHNVKKLAGIRNVLRINDDFTFELFSKKTKQGREAVSKCRVDDPPGTVTECNSPCFLCTCMESEAVTEYISKCSAATLFGGRFILKHYTHFVYTSWWSFNEMEHFYLLCSPLLKYAVSP